MNLLDFTEIPQTKPSSRALQRQATNLLPSKTRRGKRKKNRHKLKIPQMSYYVYIGSTYWKNRKRKFFRKYGRKCSVCKSKGNIQLHHKTYKYKFGKEPDHALVALCGFHHNDFHKGHGVDKNMIKNTDRYIELAKITNQQLKASNIDDLSWI